MNAQTEASVHALMREATRLGFSVCPNEQWKQHVEQLDRTTREREQLTERLLQQSDLVHELEVRAERWGKAFDVAVELRENIEHSMLEKIEELTDRISELTLMHDDAVKGERESDDRLEKATRLVFRCLDRLGVKFETHINIETALAELYRRLMADPSVEPIPAGELPFEAKSGAALLLQYIRRNGLGVMLDEETLTAWWANIAMAGYDQHARRYSKLIELAIMGERINGGSCYSQEAENAIAEEANRFVDPGAPPTGWSPPPAPSTEPAPQVEL
ncbi:MAG TPA: hypothetical protein VFX94_01155 [Burkholderiales bacterium]|nr:hypothetical protein [Burkholderiales bacterium]